MSNISPNLQVRATAIAEDGHGIAEEDGLEILVPDLLPGECAEVTIEHRSQHRKRAWATIVSRVGDLAPERQAPACPAFGKCGGCVWQHLSYPAQLDAKRQRVQDAMSALSPAPNVPMPLGAPSPLHYRNKGKYVFSKSEGEVTLGAYRTRSHEVVSTMGCQVVQACIDEAAQRLLEIVCEQDIQIFDSSPVPPDQALPAGLRYAILQANSEGKVLATLVCTFATEAPGMQAVASALVDHPSVVGVLRCDNDLRSGRLLTAEISILAGEGRLRETVSGVPISLGPRSFWQVHHAQAQVAYQAIADALPQSTDAPLLELYTGSGGIAFSLAKAGHKITAVDISEEATSAATLAAAAHGLSELLEFRCADATRLAPELFQEVGAVIVDPPRKGLGKAGVAQLVDAKPPRIIYMSCGPESLANDLAKLCAAGYQIDSLQLFDFMPGTAQVECLAVLTLAT